MKKVLVFLTLFVFLAGTSMAQQKYGHLNLGNLIEEMPATAKADAELEAFQKQLIAKGEEMAKKFQEDYGKFVTDVQSGDLSPVQQQERQNKLQADQQALVNYEQEIQQKVQGKRQELLTPIITEAEKAIAEVAKENGYLMIFDSSIFNAILYMEDANDVMDKVKAKLGL